MQLVEIIENSLDYKNAEDVKQLISKSAVHARLKEVAGKRITGEVIEVLNLVFNTIVDDIGENASRVPGKTMTLQDLQLILGLTRDINITIGTFNVKKVSHSASKKLVQHLVRTAVRELRMAEESGDVNMLLDKYDVLSDDDLEKDIEE